MPVSTPRSDRGIYDAVSDSRTPRNVNINHIETMRFGNPSKETVCRYRYTLQYAIADHDKSCGARPQTPRSSGSESSAVIEIQSRVVSPTAAPIDALLRILSTDFVNRLADFRVIYG